MKKTNPIEFQRQEQKCYPCKDYKEKKSSIIRWLRSNGFYERFMHNLRKLKAHYDPFSEEELDKFLITKSFVWMNTPESTRFWNDVDSLFKRFYNNYIIEARCEFKVEEINVEEEQK